LDENYRLELNCSGESLDYGEQELDKTDLNSELMKGTNYLDHNRPRPLRFQATTKLKLTMKNMKGMKFSYSS